LLIFISSWLYLDYTLGIGIVNKKKEEKIVEKYFLFGMIFAGRRLAQDLLCLPFWQKSRGACHFGSLTG